MPTSLDQILFEARHAARHGVRYADSNGACAAPYYAPTPDRVRQLLELRVVLARALWAASSSAAGVTLGPPSATVQGTDINENIAAHAKLGYRLHAWVQAVAHRRARRLSRPRGVEPYLPVGKTVNDYFQNLFGVSGDVECGSSRSWAKYFNHYDTPVRRDGLDNQSFYVQAVYSFIPGWDVAVRYDRMRFDKVANSTGESVTWDAPIDRWETGINYHVTRELVARV